MVDGAAPAAAYDSDKIHHRYPDNETLHVLRTNVLRALPRASDACQTATENDDHDEKTKTMENDGLRLVATQLPFTLKAAAVGLIVAWGSLNLLDSYATIRSVIISSSELCSCIKRTPIDLVYRKFAPKS